MSHVRILARVPRHVEGECLESYIERLAAMHHVDLLVTLQSVGMISDERRETINGYGVLMDEVHLDRFSTATKMARMQAASMLMSSYTGTALDLSETKQGDAASLRKHAMDEWAYFSGTHVCPQCVHENAGAWQLAWKLPWTFVCTKHKTYVIPYCPGCRCRFRSRRDRRLSPVFVRHIPVLGVCNNPKPSGESAIGKGATICGHVLLDIPSRAAGRSALAAQCLLNKVLTGTPQTVLGAPVTPREFFGDLRSICALILSFAEAEDLERISEFERDVFLEFTKKRNATHAGRKESATPRNGDRVRTFIGAPDDPILMAAIVGHSLKILESPDLDTMANFLKPIAERCIGRASKARWNVMDYFRFSVRIAPAFHLGLTQRSSFNRAMGNRSLSALDGKYNFDPCHVPQLIWEADFDAQFSIFFPEVGANYARRFCSMSLVKLVGDLTWGDTARLLGLPEHPGIKLANRCVGFLTDEKTKERFSHALHLIAKRLSENPHKIDYGQRREAFAELRDIPNEDWAALCARARITPGKPGRRSRYAATWLWSYLTDGDWTLAPALEGENTVNSREVYRSLVSGVLLNCRGALIDYGANLLAKLERSNYIEGALRSQKASL